MTSLLDKLVMALANTLDLDEEYCIYRKNTLIRLYLLLVCLDLLSSQEFFVNAVYAFLKVIAEA